MRAGKYLKPYQGLKQSRQLCDKSSEQCRKIPKTLSGIETQSKHGAIVADQAGKYLKPYQGLKLRGSSLNAGNSAAGKYLKPYQGLKLLRFIGVRFPKPSRKIPKTLSGIETQCQ